MKQGDLKVILDIAENYDVVRIKQREQHIKVTEAEKALKWRWESYIHKTADKGILGLT